MAEPRKRGVVNLGAPSERLLKLAIDSHVPDPYEVTDTIVIEPLTKKRGTALREAHMSLLVYQTLLNAAMQRTNTPRPDPPAAGASEDVLAAHEVAVQKWQTEIAGNEQTLKDLGDNIAKAEEQYNRAFFGDSHDAVMEFFETQPQRLWDAFVEDIKSEFLPAAPKDGVCPTCGNVEDEEEAGKASKSST